MKVNVKSVKVKISKDVIEQLNKAKGRAAELTAQAILADLVSRGVVPKDTGVLESSGYVQKINDFVFNVIYNTPYARRWYFNLDDVRFKRDTAIDHWMDYYLDEEGKAWVIDTYIKFFKQEAGGIIK